MPRYALVRDDTIAKTGKRPNWRIGDPPRPLTEAEWIEQGYLPILPNPPFDPETEKLVSLPQDEWTINADSVGPTHTVEPLTQAELGERAASARATLIEAIDAERDRRTHAGIEWNGARFQTRPSDLDNVAGAATLALAAIVNGAQPGDLNWHGEDAPFRWIAEDNSMHEFDAHGFFAFAQAVARRKTDLIFKARLLKDAEEIPENYTAEVHWS